MSLVDAFTLQSRWCTQLGSPFAARQMDRLAALWQRGGALRTLLPDWPGDPVADAVPLRVLGALHALVLDGRASALAAHWPPHVLASVSTNDDALDETLEATLAEHADTVRAFLAVAPQTNEIGRSAVLLGGFAHIAAATGLPLATLEIGASAGLNGLWHRFRYELGDTRWGDPASPVCVRAAWRGPMPALPPSIAVASHAACDAAPIDLHDDATARRLTAYVWADQAERLARLRAAIALARETGVTVDRADAADWVEARLAAPRDSAATVLVHSIVWQYLGAERQRRIAAALDAAGARATPAAPLAWLRMEPAAADAAPALQLTMWPGGETRTLAHAHAHGREVTWLAA